MNKTKGLVLAGLLLSGSANAAFVESWDYSFKGQFLDYDPHSKYDGDGGVEVSGDSTKLSWGWGDVTPKSSLEVVSNRGSGLKTNGDSVRGLGLLHRNNRIHGPEGVSLASFYLWGSISVSPSGRDEWKTIAHIETAGSLDETSNSVYDRDDVVGYNFGAVNVIPPVWNGEYEPYGFWVDGINYDWSFGSANLITLSDGQCEKFGRSSGCYGFTTPEGSRTEHWSKFNITGNKPHIDVPEPASLGLLGLGVVILGLVGNRRKLTSK